MRDDVVVHDGQDRSLRRFKDDVREVASGYECGIGLENYNDIKVGDIIEAYEVEEVGAAVGPGATRQPRRPPSARPEPRAEPAAWSSAC